MRAAEKAARDGGARRRSHARTAVDPALAERARAAAQRLTGLPARVNGGKLELHFGDETGLAELVETLEALARRREPAGGRFGTLVAPRAISSVG